MPYVTEDRRKYFLYNANPKEIANYFCAEEVGDLNYFISSIIWEIFDRNPSYKSANNLVGVLECVKAEFQRRKVAPYEDLKIQQNGDLK